MSHSEFYTTTQIIAIIPENAWKRARKGEHVQGVIGDVIYGLIPNKDNGTLQIMLQVDHRTVPPRQTRGTTGAGRVD